MSEEKDLLGREPVGRLLLKLALPTVTAQIMPRRPFWWR